jgi:hypothetical protein
MRSKNSKAITRAESEHMSRVKEQACSCCDTPGPSEAHHIKQGQHFSTVAWCMSCHRGKGGWHGDRTMFRIFKKDEVDCLAITIERMAA